MRMSSPEGTPFISEILERLRPGVLPLSAPHTDGIAQIDIKGEKHGDLDLVVDIGADLITVEREHGLPLQVEINIGEPIEGSSLKRVLRLPVFEEPIERLLMRRGDGPREWIAGGDGVRVVSEARIRKFAHTLGGFAYYKQNPNDAVSSVGDFIN